MFIVFMPDLLFTLAVSWALSGSTVSQDPLPPPPPWLGVHLYSAAGRQIAEYVCEAGQIELEITHPGFQGAPQIAAWRVGMRDASATDLARWNGWLSELAHYSTYSVACRGDWVGISLQGSRRGDGSEHSISIMWRNGEIWRTPLAAGDWERAYKEGWFPPYESASAVVE